MTVKQTAFYNIHKKLNAKIVEFAGFEMPVQYSGITDEHMTVRTTVGMFDVSHMGEFEIRGSDALALVQKVTTNDASKLFPGKVQYSAMCYPDGGIVDDLLVYRFEDHLMTVVNAANLRKDFDWMTSQKQSMRVDVIDKSDDISLLAIQGPDSGRTLQKLTKADLGKMEYYTFIHGKIAGVDAMISRTGYTGELGFEVYFKSSRSLADTVWNAIMDAGKEYSIKPIGLGARDTLRLESGFCLYGNDIDKTTNPLEAGLGWITKLEKGDFISHDVLVKVKQEGLKRKLVGFTIDEAKAFPRHGYEIKADGKKIGVVTSGTVSPVLHKGIGMGYVTLPYSQPGSTIYIVIRDKEIKAQVTKIPFIKK
jgi:glycine cleavage system T protein (aminomethyltransferase)